MSDVLLQEPSLPLSSLLQLRVRSKGLRLLLSKPERASWLSLNTRQVMLDGDVALTNKSISSTTQTWLLFRINAVFCPLLCSQRKRCGSNIPHYTNSYGILCYTDIYMSFMSYRCSFRWPSQLSVSIHLTMHTSYLITSSQSL